MGLGTVWLVAGLKMSLKPCPHCRRKVRLSRNSATVAVFCDSLTFLRQCGQGLKLINTYDSSLWCVLHLSELETRACALYKFGARVLHYITIVF